MAFTSYCRLCAKFIPEIDLIDILGNRNGLETKIKQCFQLEFNDNDTISPKQACILCASKVHSFHDFLIQVQKSQLVFKTTNFIETKVEINDDLEDFKFDIHNTNSSDKFSDYDDNDGENVSDEDYEPENDIKIEIIQSRKSGPKFKKEKDEENQIEIEEDIEEMKSAFYQKVSEIAVKSFNHLISDEMYARLIREVEESEAKPIKMPGDLRRLNRFEVLITDDNHKKLIVRRENSTDQIKYFVPKTEMFDLIRDAHLQLNHGGRCRIESLLRSKYKNLSRDLIMLYLNLCTVCKYRKKSISERVQFKEEKPVVSKPPEPKLKCHECNQMFYTSNEITDHFESFHQKPVEFICLECSKIYNNYITYRNHLLSHKNRFRFRCEECDKFFSSNRKLQDHKQRHTQDRKKFFCSVCGKGFLDKNYLTKHEKRIHLVGDITPDTLKLHECDVCHKSFTSVSNLNTHKKIHTGIRDHTCEHCGKSFFYKKCLDHHITSHSEERPFICDLCPARFKTKMLLRQHTFVHTGIKPYQCHVCGKKFRRKPALLEHSITHTNLYPFKCEICEKRFRSKKNCVWHQRLHTGEKPYSCDMCNRHFTCSSYYDKHMKRNHGVVKVKKEFVNCSTIENSFIA